MKKNNPLNLKMHSTVTVGPKGQVVIPKDVREMVGIQPGDKLVILTKDDKHIGLTKNDDCQDIIDYLNKEMK